MTKDNLPEWKMPEDVQFDGIESDVDGRLRLDILKDWNSQDSDGENEQLWMQRAAFWWTSDSDIPDAVKELSWHMVVCGQPMEFPLNKDTMELTVLLGQVYAYSGLEFNPDTFVHWRTDHSIVIKVNKDLL